MVLVVVSAVAVGLVLHAVFPQIPLGLAIALGAVVSPTDAVAATAVGKRLGLPHRLMSVLEGESLVNDASALVVLRTAIAAVGAGFSFWGALGEFALAVVVAVAAGLLIGRASCWLRSRLDDPVLNSTVSFTVPFAAYFPAEELHASGVLATVVAGLVTGSVGAKQFSARVRQTEATNWSTISFVGESALFLLMGLQLPTLVRSLTEDSIGLVVSGTLLTLLVLIVLRALGLLVPLLNERRLPERQARARVRLASVDERLSGVEPESERERRRVEAMQRRLAQGKADLEFRENERLGRRGALVIWWAGMRGAITVAAAQTIPEDMPHRSTVVLIAFLVAATTLLGFGSTLPAVIRRMHFTGPSREDKREELMSLMQSAVQSAVDELGPLKDQTIDGTPIDPQLAERTLQRLTPLLSGKREDRPRPSPDTRDRLADLQRRYLDAIRSAILQEQSIGSYRTDTYTLALALLDAQQSRLEGLG